MHYGMTQKKYFESNINGIDQLNILKEICIGLSKQKGSYSSLTILDHLWPSGLEGLLHEGIYFIYGYIFLFEKSNVKARSHLLTRFCNYSDKK